MAMISGPTMKAVVRYLRPEKKVAPDPLGKAPDGAASFMNVEENTEEREVSVVDAREAAARNELSLDTNGFVLVRHTTRCPHFRDIDTIQASYYPEVVELVKRLTGAQHVLVSAHNVRLPADDWDQDHSKAGEEMRALIKLNEKSGLNTPHLSILDPTVPVGAPGRRSIECRVLAAFPKSSRSKL